MTIEFDFLLNLLQIHLSSLDYPLQLDFFIYLIWVHPLNRFELVSQLYSLPSTRKGVYHWLHFSISLRMNLLKEKEFDCILFKVTSNF